MTSLNKYIACCFLLTGLFISCKKDEQLKWVDLRYLAEDAYDLPSASPDPIRLQVKSTEPWVIYGKDSRWCSITPSEGPAGELFNVEVLYTENTELDDRLDTLVIKSDHWIGKWIPVRQKGIAYLELDGAEGIVLDQFGSSGQFGIRSNQNWRIVPDPSAPWLEMSGLSGSGDGTVYFQTTQQNKGEKRTAEVKVLDRHGELVKVVPVSQHGVELIPEQTLFKTDFQAKTISINVESNAEWQAVKENPDLQWLNFDGAVNDGNGVLTVSLTENNGNAIRTAFVKLQTPQTEDAEQVVKTIIIRQAHDPAPDYRGWDEYEMNEWIINGPDNKLSSLAVVGDDFKVQGAQKIHRYNLPSGNYDFYLKETSAGTMPVIYFQTGDLDFRWHTTPNVSNPEDARTHLNVVDRGKEKSFDNLNVKMDFTKSHILGIRMSGDTEGNLVMSWLLDGRVLGSYAADGSDIQTSEIPFSKDVTFHVFVGAYESGTANHYTVWDAWQYTLPYDFIDWGE